jgi:glycosyltransferase involved in cell wall biosynthesis
LDFILAAGDLGAAWYIKAGFDEDIVFPFAYFIAPGSGHPPGPKPDVVPRICYAGQLIEGKGLECLIRAMALLRDMPWKLHILGDGPRRQLLDSLAARLRLSEKIFWHGSLPYHEVRTFMATCDLFVLPSLYDGWGAVVGEALLAGVPVIVTDACGSEVLVRASGFGEVVRAGDPTALANAIEKALNRGRASWDLRVKIAKWATMSISGEAGAAYLIAILKHIYGGGPRPFPPWRLSP